LTAFLPAIRQRIVGPSYPGVYVPKSDFESTREAQRELLDHAIEEAAPNTSIEILHLVKEGAPATVLVAAAHASLLVVGSR
jgi:hypothetical protein